IRAPRISMGSLADRLRGVLRSGPKGPPLRSEERCDVRSEERGDVRSEERGDVRSEDREDVGSGEREGIRRGGPSGPPDAADILGGEWRESRGRSFLVVDRKYLPGYRHGRIAVADCL